MGHKEQLASFHLNAFNGTEDALHALSTLAECDWSSTSSMHVAVHQEFVSLLAIITVQVQPLSMCILCVRRC